MWKGTWSLLGSAALTQSAASRWNLKQKVPAGHPQTHQEAPGVGAFSPKYLTQFISISAWIFGGFWGLEKETERGQDAEDSRDPKPRRSTTATLHPKLISLWRLRPMQDWMLRGSHFDFVFVKGWAVKGLLDLFPALTNVFLLELWTRCYADKPVYGVTYLTTALVARARSSAKAKGPKQEKISYGEKKVSKPLSFTCCKVSSTEPALRPLFNQLLFSNGNVCKSHVSKRNSCGS